ncbi:hypothetical protein NC995_26330 [Leptolyngbya sp. FACHB-1515]|nr:hypothetical protein [Microcoleus sp. FACHB-1515]
MEAMMGLAEELLQLTEIGHKQVRLLGLALSNLKNEGNTSYVQLELEC